ncbi:hypothetical protein [Methylotetracoccus oryzae]|uniref:hypothetical protein n=1 Tax=Methylotetracoccus oryzae TaxID=1919059 RepID=UPI00111809DB|nr:hypothetical protein [Methylotetracoccus oryzae]
MNPHQVPVKGSACLAALLWFGVSTASAAGDCWIEVFDRTDFAGNRVRIEGPAVLPSLTQLGGGDWSDRIESLVVGPAASVTVYRNEALRVDPEPGPAYHGEAIKSWGETPDAYSDQQATFGPGKREHHLGELRFHQNIRSLKVTCGP